ncbi:MAG: ROK family protein [Isosphaeraceae bacterium]
MNDLLRLGVEIGGTKLQLALGPGDGSIVALERQVIVPENQAAAILNQILSSYGALLHKAGINSTQVDAAGIGFGGPVNSQQGVVTLSHHVAGWERFPIASWFRENLGITRVALENDADVAGLGEARFGAGQGISPLLYLTVGSGIGGGLILNGKIYRGAGAGAIELGHLWVTDRFNSDQGVVTLEAAASGWAIASEARRVAERLLAEGRNQWIVLKLAGGDPAAIETTHIAEAAKGGDRQSRLLLDKAVHAMALGLGQAVTILAPRRIILGGGVSLIGEELWLGPIRKQLDACVFPPFRGTFDLVGASLGEEVVLQGALALAKDLVGRPS